MRAIHQIPFKTDASKKVDFNWELAFPNVYFTYIETKDGKETIFTSKLDFYCLLEKFGLQKDGNDINNVNALSSTLEKCFEDNRVNIEIWQKKYYTVEFKAEDKETTLFKLYLKND